MRECIVEKMRVELVGGGKDGEEGEEEETRIELVGWGVDREEYFERMLCRHEYSW